MGTARVRIRLRQLAIVFLVAGVLAPTFNVLTSDASVGEAVQGVLDAAIITLLVGGYLFFLRDGALRLWFRQQGFVADLALHGVILIALFLVGRALGQIIVTGNPRRLWLSFTDTHLLYALPFFVVLTFAIQFVIQMNRMIGTNVLGYFIAGVYRQPKAEERIFLFVDLEGSTQHAERLGSARYFELLRRFVDDLSDAVVESGGEIYQYAGDEVVITWRLDVGVHAAACVRCFFDIRAALDREASRYQRDFGVVPRFRGGLHGGLVTAGELGDLRQQIVFVGDILNTAARLEEYAKRSGRELVVSGALLHRLTLPPGIVAAHCGELALRGKEATVAAYGLTAAANPPMVSS